MRDRRRRLTTSGSLMRAGATTVLVAALLIPQAVAPPPSSAATASSPQVALAEMLLSAALDTTRPPAQRAIDTARVALDARQSVVDARLRPLLDQEARNLDTAQRILEMGSPEGTDTLAFGIEVAKVATEWQAGTMGLDLSSASVVVSHHALPSQAIKAFVESQGGTLTEPQHNDLLRLDALSGTAPQALADVVDAFAKFEAATRLAYAKADQARLEAIKASVEAGTLDANSLGLTSPADLKAVLGIDLGPVLGARSELLDVVVPLRDALSALGSTEQMSAGTDFQFAPYYAIELDLAESNTYTQDFMLQLDVGGNDVYLNSAGAGSAFRVMPAATLLDLLGNDQYVRGDMAINGGGNFGSGVLIDGTGTDTYTAGGRGSNGGGIAGTGLLIDGLGGNQFSAGSEGTNGGGAAGAGILVDVLNNGPISAGGCGTNGGACVGGSGFFFGATGSQLNAGSQGTNGGGMTGGVGFVLAGALASNTYAAGSGGVNGGGGSLATTLVDTAGGIGFLFDGGGADVYSGTDRGVNGGGIIGAGLLVDVLGDDRYFARDRGTNGGGNGGTGLLMDMAGSDQYQAGSIGTNGGGSFAGAGMLFDASGTDSYAANTGGANGGGSIGTGALIDGLGSNDSYSDAEGGTGSDKTVAPKGLAGAQLDNPPIPPPPTTTTIPLPPTTLPSTTTSSTSSTTTSSLPLPPTTVPPTPPVIAVDFENVEPCSSHPINDDSLFGIWHSPLAGGSPYSVCVVLHFPIEMRVRITVDPDALNP